MLAQRVHSVEGGQTGGVKWVTVRGTVDAVQDGGPLVVNGVSVTLSLLTEMPFGPEVGDAVDIRALINSSGDLVADQVNLQEGETGETRAYLVDVYGVIGGPKEDGGPTINGLPLSLSPLSQVGGGLEPGSNVRVLESCKAPAKSWCGRCWTRDGESDSPRLRPGCEAWSRSCLTILRITLSVSWSPVLK